MRVAIIPARGGSKRIPRKNIRNFFGKPMLAWSILAAKDSGCIDRVIVSTDDPEIAEVARNYGAEVPFMRPDNLADDYAGTAAVMQDAVYWLVANWQEINEVCCLYATAPFVTGEYLRRGLEELLAAKAEYAFSVSTFAFPIERALNITKAGRIAMRCPEHLETRSQDLPEAYHDAGQFYWGTKKAWLEGKTIFGDHSVPVVLPRHMVQDIDTLEDWERASYMFDTLQRQQKG